MDKKTMDQWKEKLPDIARHTSEMERASVEAEREVDDLKKAEYMADKIGEEYIGTISSVTNFGSFVELDNTVEGLIHVSYMIDDYYDLDEQSYALMRHRKVNVHRISE